MSRNPHGLINNPTQAFNYKNLAVRALEIDGQTWLVGDDVCRVLGNGNPRQALSRLEDYEKGVHIVDTLGGKQRLILVNESGLYSLILTSRMPEARKFKRKFDSSSVEGSSFNTRWRKDLNLHQ